MHTIGARDTVFEMTVDGRASSLAELMPCFGDADRLALVVRTPLGGLGASGLIFAMVIDFYNAHDEQLRALAPGELLYPEHYVVHVGTARGDYSWLDFWPPHKEIVVAGDDVVRTLIELGITRILIEDDGSPPPATRDDPPPGSSGQLAQQLLTCIAFSPSGRTVDADITVVSNTTVEHWVDITIDPIEADPARPNDSRFLERAARYAEVSAAERDVARSARQQLRHGLEPVETYRRLTVPEAVAMLT